MQTCHMLHSDVAHSNPAHIFIDSSILCTTLSPSWLGLVVHKSTSSTKPKPDSEYSWANMAQRIWVINPSEVKIWNKGELTAAQIWGPAPFPWPILAVGRLHFAWPWLLSESPKAVWTWCFKLASVWIIFLTAECGAPSLHRLKAAIIRTIWL